MLPKISISGYFTQASAESYFLSTDLYLSEIINTPEIQFHNGLGSLELLKLYQKSLGRILILIFSSVDESDEFPSYFLWQNNLKSWFHEIMVNNKKSPSLKSVSWPIASIGSTKTGYTESHWRMLGAVPLGHRYVVS